MKTNSELATQISRLSDEELAQMLTERSSDYTPQALAVAKQEATRRGGLEDLINRVARVQEEEHRQTELEQLRRDDVRHYYTYVNHVIEIGRRWLLQYGVLVLLWIGFQSQQSEARYALGIVFVTVLFLLYAVVWGLLTYGRAVKERYVVACPSCNKPLLINASVVRAEATDANMYQQECPMCGKRMSLDSESMEAVRDKL